MSDLVDRFSHDEAHIPDKKRNAYSDIFPFSLPFFGSSCLIHKIVTNYRFVTKLQCDINKCHYFYLA